jgi:hypothetical protein
MDGYESNSPSPPFLFACPYAHTPHNPQPNIHNIPVDLSKFRIENKDHTGKPDIFLPTDEPHGMIQAVVERPRGARL